MSVSSRIYHRRRIGEILVDEGVVSREDVEEALRFQKNSSESLGTILIDMGCCSATDITKTICIQYQLPYIKLSNYEIDNKVHELFPKEFLHKNRVFPFDKISDVVLVVLSEIPSEAVLAEIPKLTKLNAAIYIGTYDEVDEYLHAHCPLPKPKKKKISRAQQMGDAGIFEEDSSEALLEALDSTWDSIFDGMETGHKIDPDDE